jgi:hypothetical protein
MKPSENTTFAKDRHPIQAFGKVPLIFSVLLIVTLTACYPAAYREPPRASAAPAVQPPVTQVFFYPKKGQTQQQQSRDHFECYNWAVH